MATLMWVHKNKSTAFGLIEVMAALAIIVVVVTATGAVSRQALKVVNNNSDQLIAQGIAQRQIEQFKADVKQGKDLNNQGITSKIILNNIEYQIEMNYETKSASSGKQYYEVIAAVSWKSSDNHKEQKTSLGTIVDK